MFVVVSYDIVDDRRRTKVANTLLGFGSRVQYSVFECVLKPEDLDRLRKRLRKLIKAGEDQVRYYQLCQSCVLKVVVDGGGGVTKKEGHRVI